MKKNKQFTLIELLVVIAIFTILVSILTPSLRKARKQTILAVCKSNLHQTGVQLTTYAANNGGRFKRKNHADPHYINHGAGDDYLSMFVEYGGTSTLHCPLSPQDKAPEDSNANMKMTSYGIWGGWVSAGMTSLHKGSFEKQGYEFDILVADWERISGTNRYYTSHPDTAGDMWNTPWDNRSYFGSYWRNYDGNRSGTIERNFLHVDLSISFKKDLKLRDSRLVGINWGSYNYFLPEKE
jgi:prepilin-type N-terminal cleavage/methylation domain-containing protein